ncbi:hypothetical protein [Amycolatopsis regifaucium]|uniref:PknH-like extracellular domain-containing protein n=1 Tax=Amycolatopsis regifaucium TaxID=546365 RepID=A0A154M5F6_9PSEU|nr:hypothetical protein [Amycolatopsis regifaucium]KZB79733.1 hypothetical protein AVL48_15150 [Amycolatopsis regifaucium]OKA09950.1 hypothetical protein ATP06_0206265 [Amycolatopsis regifaucium]SFI67841.1 hypothetical protein SAMN04489731_112133 [Amycolatopsis regifaucium]
MAARIRRTSRFSPPQWRGRAVALVASAAAVATISGASGESIQAAATPTAPPPPAAPAVPPAALLPPETVPNASARDGFDLGRVLSTSDIGSRVESRIDVDGCEDVVHGKLVGANATGQGFQSAVPGGQVSELVARTTNPPDLTAWAGQAARCSKVTVDDAAGTAVSTVTVHPAPAVPNAKTLSYEQFLTLPGQPPELPGLRLRTVAIAADDVLVVLRDVGTTGLDLDALAVTAWQHAAGPLGR